MHREMSPITRQELLSKLRRHYENAGLEYRHKLLNQAVDLLGYHRKAAIRALNFKPPLEVSAPAIIGRPREYDPAILLKPLKVIWLAARQPCGRRLHAALPDWVKAYEEDHQRLPAKVRQGLLAAGSATLDRLLRPIKAEHRRRAGTRPGTLLRQQIPIRTEWQGEGPGYLEMDTVALCGGALDDRHLWMFDSVDIQTTWVEMRALPNRSQAATLEQIQDVESSLPFFLAGIDSDNGGEFINHHLLAWAHQRPRPLAVTRGRAYRKNDNAHIEQKNYTHVREWFGYERHDNPGVVAQINTLCKGALGQLLNYFLPNLKLEAKIREGSQTKRVYGPAQTPLDRVLAQAEVAAKTKQDLRRAKASLNPFQLRRDIDKALKEIDQQRQFQA